METSKEQDEEAHAFLDRTSRPTRGKRMNKLLDEEIEEDELFWNQEALKDVLFSLSLSLSLSLNFVSNIVNLEINHVIYVICRKRMMLIMKKSKRLLMSLIVTSMKM